MVDVQYDQERHVVVFTTEGVLSLKDIVVGTKQWIEHLDFKDDTNMLWDLRNASWQTAVSEFLLLSDEIINRVNEIWSGERIACLVDTKTEIALVDSHLGSLGWKARWKGFNNYKDAMAWLCEQPEPDKS
jgi:hypothetical protein